ncbi:NACHT domain-containing protein [Streptomyces sp. 4F14]|uniref:NACHT domain-containing protein n=1 Tax=Streptomyces sp. 4F14 TaxID=3394380 RepID=UPI003A85D6A7
MGGRSARVLVLLAGVVIAVAALALAFDFELGVAAPAVDWLMAVSIVLVGMYAGWLGERFKPRTRTLSEVADELARDVRDRWDRQTALWNSRDPGMSVGWRAEPGSPDGCLEGLSGVCAGGYVAGGGLADVLDRVPTRRLVVLGEAGTGKTTLLAHLVLSLLDQASGTEPVPVLVPLASWDVPSTGFEEWLETQLPAQHRCLSGALPHGSGRSSLVRALLSERRLLLVLDGLDELPEPSWREALEKIDASPWSTRPLVLSSRPEAYRLAAGLDVSSPPYPRAARLRSAAAVTLLPLDDAAVEAYLTGDAPNQGYAGRWDPVIARLRSSRPEPVAEVMRVPLLAWLARSVYGPDGTAGRDRGGPLPDPAELCDRERFASVGAIEEHLFRNFLPSAYRDAGPPGRHRWDAGSAGKILGHLARNTELLRVSGTRRWWLPIEYWWLAGAVTAGTAAGECRLLLSAVDRLIGPFPAWLSWVPLVWLAYLLVQSVGTPLLSQRAQSVYSVAGWWCWPVVAAVVAGWWLDLPGLWTIGCCVGVTFPFFPAPEENHFGYLRGSARLESAASWSFAGGVCCVVAWSVGSLRLPLLTGLACGLAYQVVRRLLTRITPLRGWLATPAPLAGAVGVALAMALELDWHGLDREDLLSGWPRTPLVAASACWLIAVVVCNGLRHWHGGWVPAPLVPRAGWLEAVVVLPVALWFGSGLEPDWQVLGVAVLVAAWTPLALSLAYRPVRLLLVYLPARACLALSGRLPWHLRSFLEDAHRRGVLRRNGALYEFRHIELRRHLDNQP